MRVRQFDSTTAALNEADRRGAIAPLAGVMLIVLIALMAFAVDISWMVQVNTELQNVADASALAASGELMNNYALYQLPSQSDDQKLALLSSGVFNARAVARAVASKNSAGGVSALKLLDQDIEFGFLNENYEYAPMTDTSSYPNTVRVAIRRDDVANTPLDLFIAPALASKSQRRATSGPLMANCLFASTSSVSLSRSASASLHAGFVGSFDQMAVKTPVLPFTLDEYVWDEFIRTGANPYTSQKRIDADNNPVLEIYSNFKSKGNFGGLSLDGYHSGASETRDWIQVGMSSNDVQSLMSLGLLPVTATNEKWNWIGNPGYKASAVMDVNDYVGRIYLLPLFKAKNGSSSDYQAGVGQGSNYYYNIRRFVGVRIMPTNKSNNEIVVQPSAIVDPAMVFSDVKPAPTSKGATYTTTFTLPLLTN